MTYLQQTVKKLNDRNEADDEKAKRKDEHTHSNDSVAPAVLSHISEPMRTYKAIHNTHIHPISCTLETTFSDDLHLGDSKAEVILSDAW